jgi:hypothetical protein
MRLQKPFAKTGIESFEDVERFQDVVENVLGGISASPIISGQLVADVYLDTAAKRVEHKLGRKPLGYIVVRQDASETIYEQTEVRKDLFLNLAASGPVTVSLWVF